MSDEERLADLLLRWEELFDQRQDTPAQELCKDCPELTEALAERIAALKRVAWVNEPIAGDDPDGGPENGGTPPQNTPGLVLGIRYRLEKQIAEGGFGEVWQGFDLELQRAVAVKVPRPSRPSSTAQVESFLAEARKVARLKHSGIVPVHDVGRHDGAYFIVSELIDGTDLEKHILIKPPSVQVAARIVAEVAELLHYAHDQGFVHRDIKPANILLDRQERIFITDFGIAATEEELSRGANSLGTLHYMSPEQLFGENNRIDTRTDIYSLGLVLYELLTGRLPFQSENPAMLRQRILESEPLPPRSLKPALPKELERICLKCLAKSPANRYPNAKSLAGDLTRWLNRRRTNWILVCAGVFCCLLLVWLAVLMRPSAPEAPDADMQVAVNLPGDRLGPELTLFNGKNTDGWEFMSQEYGSDDRKKKATLDEAIRIVDGVIVCREEPRYWLYTREKYGNFVLKLDYRFPHKPKWATGSAVLIRMPQPGPHHDAHVRVRIGGWSTARILPPFHVLPQGTPALVLTLLVGSVNLWLWLNRQNSPAVLSEE